MEPKLSKSIFLAAAASAGISLFGCSSPHENIPPTPTQIERQATQEFPADMRQRLFTEINTLPPSAIKTLLTQRTLPYFQNTPPYTLSRSGFTYKIQRSSVVELPFNGSQPTGAFTFRGGQPPELFHPIKQDSFQVPIVDIVLPNENVAYPTAKDGTHIKQVTLSPSDNVYEGVAPVIIMYKPEPNGMIPDQALEQAEERYIYIKEACTVALDDLLTEDIYLKMHGLGYPTTQDIKRSDGTTVNIEIVNQLITQLDQQGGRIRAVPDIAANLLALTALSPSDLEQLKKVALFTPIINSLPSINLGTDPHSILSQSFTWALTNPYAQRLPYQGNLGIIP